MKLQTQVYFLFVVVLLIGVYTFYKNNKPKIVCVDMVKIMNQSNEIKAMMKEFEGRENVLKAREDTVTNEFQNDIKEFEKRGSKNSDKDKQDFTRRLNEKQHQFIQYKKATELKIEEQRSSASKKVVAKINQITEKFAKEHNYEIVLGATGIGNIIYLNTSSDITDEIIKLLNDE